PLGIFLGACRFYGRSALLIVNRTLMGMPPVVCGLLFYMLFSATEIPENLNFYFLAEKFPLLKCCLPRPEGLLPLAGAGTALLIFHRRFRGRFLLPGIVIVLLMFPLAARIPIGRYRMMMIPYLIVSASFVWVACRGIGRSWIKGAGTIAVVAAAFFLFFRFSPARVAARSDDFVAWGIAAAEAGDRATEENSFRLAWRAAANRAAAVRLYALYLEEQRGGDALALSREYLALRPDDELFRLYEAIALSLTGASAEAIPKLDGLEKSAADETIRSRAAALKRILTEKK
ncbi:MAG: hypothetical protein MJ016_07695, partial [Victivallaceae bacterium]|nr:hypothetical protein [Victivallaceae bacterium]